MTTFTLPTLPGVLHWLNAPQTWRADPVAGLTITAGPQTDLFTDPAGAYAKDNAPCAVLTPPDANFLFGAKVTVDFGAVFDAGVLQLRAGADRWAKLCFEYSPQRRPTVVSVVTRGVSDDANGVEIAGSTVYLRMACTPQTVAFHYSHDGHVWQLVRYFGLGAVEPVHIGFSAQSPTGEQCTAHFAEITYQAGVLADLRNGS